MRQVDPWRFTGGFLSKILSARIPGEPNHPEIPWVEVRKPLAESKLALLSTAGLSMRGDAPFDCLRLFSQVLQVLLEPGDLFFLGPEPRPKAERLVTSAEDAVMVEWCFPTNT